MSQFFLVYLGYLDILTLTLTYGWLVFCTSFGLVPYSIRLTGFDDYISFVVFVGLLFSVGRNVSIRTVVVRVTFVVRTSVPSSDKPDKFLVVWSLWTIGRFHRKSLPPLYARQSLYIFDFLKLWSSGPMDVLFVIHLNVHLPYTRIYWHTWTCF